MPEENTAEEDRDGSRDAEGLAACFTVHARSLFGYACVVSDADRPQAGDLVQAAFEAAATVWCTLRDLPADQCHGWLRDTLAAEAQRRTGHPAGRAFVSPTHRRLTELQMTRFGADYDAVAALDRFSDWLRTHAGGPSAGGVNGSPDGLETGPDERAHQPGARLAGRPGIRPAGLSALSSSHLNGARANGTRANGSPDSGPGTSGVSPNSGIGSTHGTGAPVAPGSYGDPVSVLYEQHYDPLVRLAALLVPDTATAEEIVQDSFVAVAAGWRRRGRLDCPLDFLRQSVLDRSRSVRSPSGRSPSGRSPSARSRSPLRHAVTPAPFATPAPEAGSPALLAALGALPARQREVLVMRYYANLSEEQAADALGISRAAVRRHATRANAALRTLIEAS